MRSFAVKAVVLITVTSFTCASQMAWAARFVDLGGSWCERYINTLSDQGVIAAEPDGKFRPNQPVTRAVFAYWLVKVLGLDGQPVSGKQSYADVKPSDWFYKPVEIIRQNNYVSGYADGFRPNQFLQKSEVITIISRTMNSPAPDAQQVDRALSTYVDASKIPAWAKTGIAEATLAGIVVGPQKNVLDPTALATRADTAAMLSNLNQFVTKQTIQDKEQIATQVPSVGQPGNYPPMEPAGAGGAPPNMVAQGYGGAQGYPQQQSPYPQQQQQPAPPGYPGAQYQGSVQQQSQYAAPPTYTAPPTYAQPGQYLPPQQAGYPPQNGGVQGYAPPQMTVAPNNGFPFQGQTGAMGGFPPAGQMLQGGVATVGAGTTFQAKLINSLDSETTQPGEQVTAQLSSPLTANGAAVVPAGSTLIGQVTAVTSAKRFKFGANGKIDVKFTQIQTPDGRKIPLTASIDQHFNLQGGTTKGRVGKSLLTTGIGAGGGAALGTGLGAIVGATSRGQVGKATGMGAVFGTALGGGVGLVGAGVRKGSEIKIKAGTELPIKLDQAMQVAAPVAQQPAYAPYAGGGASYGGAPQGYPQQGGYPQPMPGGYQQQPMQGGYPAQTPTGYFPPQ